MSHTRVTILVVIFQISILLFSSSFISQTEGVDFTAYDLINSVNSIRVSQGVKPVQVNSTIMSVAQAQSDFQAATRRSSHADQAGGIVTDRVAASGYGAGQKIVAGENVASLTIGIEGMLPIIVNEIWADPVHRGAMINPKYQDAGVGIASDGEMIYVTLNLAGVVEDNSSTPAVSGTQGTENVVPNPAIQPLFTATAYSDGSVYHTVGYGQTLGTIARIYNIDIANLVQINQIDPDKIYAGQRLYIRKETPVPASATPLPSPSLTPTGIPSPTASPTETILPTVTPMPEFSRPREIGVVVIFILLSITVVVFLLFNKRPSS